jgi:hypothetical protein
MGARDDGVDHVVRLDSNRPAQAGWSSWIGSAASPCFALLRFSSWSGSFALFLRIAYLRMILN